MTEPFMGEIRLFAMDFAPKGWAMCNGQILPIAQNAALFSILGAVYGGNGSTTFALPDLRGRLPVHTGPSTVLGQTGGSETVTLTTTHLPPHTHVPRAAATGSSNVPTSNVWAPFAGGYAGTPTAAMAAACVTSTGDGQPHQNQSPALALSFAIALLGTLPTRP
ncbi:phage tail protein [Dactylosporangium sp. CS-033363]|uniref:phage tail protein n=1 Tax=Dactylosporangium sp. CS-033363 TaxID=3239935 RepID=UPI003D8A8C2E